MEIPYCLTCLRAKSTDCSLCKILTSKQLHLLIALAPSYLAELVSLQVPRCVGLCSQADDLKLVVPPPRMETRGERAFSSYAPRICNNLPLTLRSLSSLSSFRRSSINIFLNLLSNNRMCVPPPKRRLTITYNYYYYYKQLNSSKCCI